MHRCRLAIICCYIGPFPNYFPLWLKSCAANPSIDWLLVTDQEISGLPPNVKVVPATLPELEARARENTGLAEIRLPHPYKLCDLKVMYGEIFRDVLDGYDFWGHCDMDMVFGDIRRFLTDEILEKNDKILTMGHLSLYRNTPECNRRYRLPGAKFDYRKMLASPRTFCFDEWPGIYGIYEHNHFPCYKKVVYADISWQRRRFTLNRRTSEKYEPAPPNYQHQLFHWENGRLFRSYENGGSIERDEFVYIHFFRRKFPDLSFDPATAGGFFLSPKGFFRKEPGIPVTKGEIRRLNPYFGSWYEAIERKIRRRLLKRRNKQLFAGRELRIDSAPVRTGVPTPGGSPD